MYVFLKSTLQEGQDGVILLNSDESDVASDDPEAVALMIEYLYCMDYTVRQRSVS